MRPIFASQETAHPALERLIARYEEFLSRTDEIEEQRGHEGTQRGRSEQIANVAKIRLIAKNPKDGSSGSEQVCTEARAGLLVRGGGEAANPQEFTGRPGDFPSVRKWDSLSLRIAVSAVQVIARREDYIGQNRCRPTQHSQE